MDRYGPNTHRKIRYGSVRTRHRYPTLRYVWYNFNAGTRHSGKLVTTSNPVPDTGVSSIRPPKIPRVPVYSTEHTLAIFRKDNDQSTIFHYRVGRCMSPPPWAVFQARLLDIKDGANTERYVCTRSWDPENHRNTSSESSRQDVSTADLLGTDTTTPTGWRCRACKIGPGECDLHRRIRYCCGATPSALHPGP